MAWLPWYVALFYGAAHVAAQDLFLRADEERGQEKRTTRPNIVWFLTDDQDQMLGSSFPTFGATPMPKTRRLMEEAGMQASNWYIHTPICSPSRSELLTGRYFHNVKQEGPSYMHVNYTTVNENHFLKILKEEAGYTTGLFGKYVNVMPKSPPEGFDAWLANGGGDYIGPEFQAKNIDGIVDGKVKFGEFHYTTAVVGNTSIQWIKKVAGQGKPFFAYIAPKAAHEPFIPAPWYLEHWDESWPAHEPRPENWNCSFESRKNHHGTVATEPMITEFAAKIVTGVFKNRWRTLMSVDDVIGDVVQTVSDLGLLDSTYFFYSSDHGFQLGQFNILMDKRHVYEWNTKIHLLARGPGIQAGSVMPMPGTQVDIAPTLLGLAGVRAPSSMDGKSIVPFLVDPLSNDLFDSTREHLQSLGDLAVYRDAWRNEVFIEYYFCDNNVKCTVECDSGVPTGDYPHKDSNCVDLANNADCWCQGKPSDVSSTCYATETPANNFIALRMFDDEGTLYAEFQSGNELNEDIKFDAVDFVEHYHVGKDTWQMHNLHSDSSLSPKREVLSKRLHEWFLCAGSTCP